LLGRTCPDDVAAVKGFVGERVTNLNRLADIDYMLADRDGNVRLLAELEERGVSPKKLLGDVLAIMMCRRCAVLCGSDQRYFDITPDTELIVAGALPLEGNRLGKVNGVIQPRVREMTALPGGLSPANVWLVFDTELVGPKLHIRNRVHDIVSGIGPGDRGSVGANGAASGPAAS
jgi:hypothetical protein